MLLAPSQNCISWLRRWRPLLLRRLRRKSLPLLLQAPLRLELLSSLTRHILERRQLTVIT